MVLLFVETAKLVKKPTSRAFKLLFDLVIIIEI